MRVQENFRLRDAASVGRTDNVRSTAGALLVFFHARRSVYATFYTVLVPTALTR